MIGTMTDEEINYRSAIKVSLAVRIPPERLRIWLG